MEKRKVATIKMAIFRIIYTAPPTVGYADTRRLRLSTYSGPVRARQRRTLNSAKMVGGLGQEDILAWSWLCEWNISPVEKLVGKSARSPSFPARYNYIYFDINLIVVYRLLLLPRGRTRP